MKKLIFTTFLFLLMTNLFAEEVTVPPSTPDFVYKNLRESQSSLITAEKRVEVEKLYKDTKSLNVLHSIITDHSINRCATKVLSAIRNKLNLKSKTDVEYAILGLRLDDSIDDISAKILMNTNDLSIMIPNPISRDELNSEEEDKALEVFKTKAVDIRNKNLCIEDSYRDLVSSLASKEPKFYRNLKHINKLALDNNLVSEENFKMIELFRAKKVYEWPITLSDYARSLDVFKKKFVDRKKESAPFVTNVKYRQKKSMRQSLYEKYDSTQIILLANIVRDLKKRLDSKDITINIDYSDQPTEIINLAPMEKFRFILKLLRKELANINNSSLLNGKYANYLDLITASYEVGYINSNEIEQLASLQEIWNPSKTTKEKVMYWVSNFGGMASIFLPPPYGFVSVMAIMMIDQQLKDAPVDRNADYILF